MSFSPVAAILHPAVLARLDEMAARYNELLELMADPEVGSNPGLYQKYAREHGALAKRVELYGQLKLALEQKESAQSVLESDEDPEMNELAEEELAELSEKEMVLCTELQNLLIQDDANDNRNVIMELRAGTGGDEAGLFAMDLFRMYSRYAERNGWRIEEMEISRNEAGGIKEATFSIQGKGVYRRLKFESGGHRVQRIPATETSGRIHTSAATVAVLPEVDDVEIEIGKDDIKEEFYGASGPGGQHVNKTSSAVRLTHLPTGIVVQCQDERSQHKNRMKALRVLRARLYDEELREREANRAATRKSMVGSGDRSQRIRTYNFPQDRLTDHRINLTTYGLDKIMDGDIGEALDAMLEDERVEKLKNFEQFIS